MLHNAVGVGDVAGQSLDVQHSTLGAKKQYTIPQLFKRARKQYENLTAVEWQAAHKVFYGNMTGVRDYREVRELLYAVGQNLLLEDVEKLCKEVGFEEKDFLQFDQFTSLLTTLKKTGLRSRRDPLHEATEAFNAVVGRARAAGVVDEESVEERGIPSSILKEICEDFSLLIDIDGLLTASDGDADGFVDFNEFRLFLEALNATAAADNRKEDGVSVADSAATPSSLDTSVETASGRIPVATPDVAVQEMGEIQSLSGHHLVSAMDLRRYSVKGRSGNTPSKKKKAPIFNSDWPIRRQTPELHPNFSPFCLIWEAPTDDQAPPVILKSPPREDEPRDIPVREETEEDMKPVDDAPSAPQPKEQTETPQKKIGATNMRRRKRAVLAAALTTQSRLAAAQQKYGVLGAVGKLRVRDVHRWHINGEHSDSHLSSEPTSSPSLVDRDTNDTDSNASICGIIQVPFNKPPLPPPSPTTTTDSSFSTKLAQLERHPLHRQIQEIVAHMSAENPQAPKKSTVQKKRREPRTAEITESIVRKRCIMDIRERARKAMAQILSQSKPNDTWLLQNVETVTGTAPYWREHLASTPPRGPFLTRVKQKGAKVHRITASTLRNDKLKRTKVHRPLYVPLSSSPATTPTATPAASTPSTKPQQPPWSTLLGGKEGPRSAAAGVEEEEEDEDEEEEWMVNGARTPSFPSPQRAAELPPPPHLPTPQESHISHRGGGWDEAPAWEEANPRDLAQVKAMAAMAAVTKKGALDPLASLTISQVNSPISDHLTA